MILQKIAKYSRVVLDPAPYLVSKNYILILSHMRSRSTLLSHILGTNEEICGYKELHLSYANKLSMLKMRVALSRVDHFRTSKYLLDKLLHNGLEINQTVFENEPKLILLLREPLGSISSMFKMHQEIHKNEKFRHLIDYYRNRLTYLAEFAEKNAGKYLFVDSDFLVSSVQSELDRVTRFLNLSSPLQPRYKQFTETGAAGAGDPSKNIKAGEVIKTKSEDKSHMLVESEKSELETHFQWCKETLTKHAFR